MYNIDVIIENKIVFLKNQLGTIQNDFRTNLNFFPDREKLHKSFF